MVCLNPGYALFFLRVKSEHSEHVHRSHPPEVAHNLHGGEIRGIAMGNRLGTDGWFMVVLGEAKTCQNIIG